MLLLGGLGAVGCGQKASPDPVKTDPHSPAVAARSTGTAEVKPDVPPAGVAPAVPAVPVQRDRQHQAFTDATRAADNPPNDAHRPPDETVSKKPVFKILDEVVRTWDTVRFVSPAGKKIIFNADVETNLGRMQIALLPELAPNHVRNFICLARAGYYNELFFDRIRHEQAEGNVLESIEAGCPLGTGEEGNGSIGYWLKDELTPGEKMSHDEGAVGACRGSEADTAACRFYITVSKASFLDGNFSLFGKVVQGLDVVRKIYQQPVIVDDQDRDGASPTREAHRHLQGDDPRARGGWLEVNCPARTLRKRAAPIPTRGEVPGGDPPRGKLRTWSGLDGSSHKQRTEWRGSASPGTPPRVSSQYKGRRTKARPVRFSLRPLFFSEKGHGSWPGKTNLSRINLPLRRRPRRATPSLPGAIARRPSPTSSARSPSPAPLATPSRAIASPTPTCSPAPAASARPPPRASSPRRSTASTARRPPPAAFARSASRIATGEDVDVLEIDGASNNGVDDIRDLRGNVQYSPARARYKIYIIDEVHMLSKGAFNALLKTLEEPPPHVKFIFATTEVDKVPITILSRCQRFDFAGISLPRIVERLRDIVAAEGLQADDEALELVARRAGGSMRDAQSLLDQLLAFGGEKLTADQVHHLLGTAGDERILALAEAVLGNDAEKALDLLDEAIAGGLQLGELIEQLIAYWRDLMVVQCGGNRGRAISASPPGITTRCDATAERAPSTTFSPASTFSRRPRRACAAAAMRGRWWRWPWFASPACTIWRLCRSSRSGWASRARKPVPPKASLLPEPSCRRL